MEWRAENTLKFKSRESARAEDSVCVREEGEQREWRDSVCVCVCLSTE